MKIHFIGINGSGIVGAACIAKNKGFEVSGCDLKKEGAYSRQLKELNIEVQEGHDVKHITNDLDLVVLTPAVLYKDKYKEIPEIVKAFETKKTIRWQEFLGEYIMKQQNTIAVCGTHGKTTTTTFASLLLENANFDPTCIIGGVVKEWNQTYRVGKSNWYIIEADEYAGNFLYYYPKYILINNLEMEHPEYFNSFEEYKENFVKFIKTIQQNGKIFFNYDDENCIEIIKNNLNFFKLKNVELFAYTFEKNKKSDFCMLESIETDNLQKFSYKNNSFEMKHLFGQHNLRNVAITSLLVNKIGIPKKTVQKTLDTFNGAGRRLDLILEKNNIKLYDDYAHHHRQVEQTIKALKTKTSGEEKIIAILEPHLISRFEQNAKDYLDYLELADYPIITKFFKSRESFREDLAMDIYLQDRNRIEYIIENQNIIKRINSIIVENPASKFSIIVMGAGNSYQLANEIKESLNG